MALIEGLGDEVTFVLGSFLIIVILLLAWISTHTDDIPLIREVGVIVVELRQRHRNRQQNRTEQQAPQDVEISQSSREGLLNSSETDDSADGFGSGVASDDSTQETSHPPSAEPPTVQPNSPSSPPSSFSNSSATHQHNQQQRETERIGSTSAAHSENNVVSSESTDISPSAEESVLVPPQSSIPSYLSRESEEETLRRRRVQYFQTGGASVFNESSNSVADSADREINNRLEGVGDNTTYSANVNNADSSKHSASDRSSNKSEPTVVSELSMPSHSTCEKKIHRQSAGATDSNLNENIDEGDTRTRTTPQNVNEGDAENGDEGHFLEGSRIRVKLKYMNETQRFVYANPEDTIGDFRRTHFQSELQDDKWVRFIFNGQDLRDDARTLQACNIENNCTMHCLVTTRQRPGDRPREIVTDDEEETMLGAMMYPLFTVILMIIWYFRIFYRQYFSAMSTVCLIGISFLLGLSYVSSLRNVNDAGNAQQQPQPPSPSSQQPQAATGGTNHPHSD